MKQNRKHKRVTNNHRQVFPTIEIIEGYKKYDMCNRQQVLKNFNMTACSGEIYALLGPHGCGKTTVLNIILGIKTLNCGLIQVFGFKPGHTLSGIPGVRVGYMPQLEGLYLEFTTYETLQYYGKLLGLSSSYVNERIEFLSGLSLLPSNKNYLRHLSKGERKKISYAAALLHEPELIVLDEPTAGLDPTLKNSIWMHMLDLAIKEDKTIILTTQQSEEAHKAHRTGIMRAGRLLLEGEPSSILQEHSENNFESIYCSIYTLELEKEVDGASCAKGKPSNTPPRRKDPTSEFYSVKNKLCFIGGNCRRLRVLVVRDFFRSIRSYMWLTLMLLIPLLNVLLFCFAFDRHPSRIKLAVVNLESGPYGCEQQYSQHFSCQILSNLDNKTITKVEYPDTESAKLAARNLEVAGVFIIGKYFSQYFQRISSFKEIDNITNYELLLSMDLTNPIVVKAVYNAVQKSLNAFTKSVNTIPAEYPLTIKSPIYGNSQSTDSKYMSPGLALMFTYFIAAYVSAMTLVIDREKQRSQRDYVAGVRLLETCLAQLITYGTVVFCQTVLVFIVLITVCEVPHLGSFLDLILIILGQICCGFMFGTLVGVLCRTIFTAGALLFCIFISTFLVDGVLWSVSALPLWLHPVSQVLPQTHAIEAVRSSMLRGLHIQHKQVWNGLVVPLCWTFLFALSSAVMSKIRE